MTLRFRIYGEMLCLYQVLTAKDDSAPRSKFYSPEQGLYNKYFVSLNGQDLWAMNLFVESALLRVSKRWLETESKGIRPNQKRYSQSDDRISFGDP